MKLIILTVLLTLITKTASQSFECVIESDYEENRFPKDNDPQLTCTCTGQQEPPNKIRWCFQSINCEEVDSLFTDANYNIETEINPEEANTLISRLTIYKIQPDDQGRYTCKTDDGSGGFSYDIEQVFADVEFSLEPEGDEQLKYGEDMVIKCTPQTPGVILWKKDNEPLDSGNNYVGDKGDIVNVNGGMLTIKDANINHGGNYECIVEDALRPKSLVLWTKVDVSADLSVKITEGHDGDIVCKARSYPEPTIKWFVGNETAIETSTDGNDEDDDIKTQITSKLKIIKAKTRQEYTCSASHKYTDYPETRVILLRIRGNWVWAPPLGIIGGILIILGVIFFRLYSKEGQDKGDEEDDDEEDNPMIKGTTTPAADPDA